MQIPCICCRSCAHYHDCRVSRRCGLADLERCRARGWCPRGSCAVRVAWDAEKKPVDSGGGARKM